MEREKKKNVLTRVHERERKEEEKENNGSEWVQVGVARAGVDSEVNKASGAVLGGRKITANLCEITIALDIVIEHRALHQERIISLQDSLDAFLVG
jgi:hypothetical protein